MNTDINSNNNNTKQDYIYTLVELEQYNTYWMYCGASRNIWQVTKWLTTYEFFHNKYYRVHLNPPPSSHVEKAKQQYKGRKKFDMNEWKDWYFKHHKNEEEILNDPLTFCRIEKRLINTKNNKDTSGLKKIWISVQHNPSNDMDFSYELYSTLEEATEAAQIAVYKDYSNSKEFQNESFNETMNKDIITTKNRPYYYHDWYWVEMNKRYKHPDIHYYEIFERDIEEEE